MIMTIETDVLEETEVVTTTEEESKIILYNDPVNSFEHVIMCLVAFCGHGMIQAEQCALIVHNKGKYAVKHGSKEDMVTRAKKLSEENLTVEVI